ncbi:1-acyl-sn-glycerol-3-phosphate acyltransferase [[Phormidium] sp. ETS-05]|uniref:1-acyl-sn-glycerol-3-phosphate acyltransferase n=1 Tax=[Phormidium] sp. ETS-05 TaxID=222819 RepID=UPI0031FE7DBF
MDSFTLPLAEIQGQNLERLAQLYQQFEQGKIRFIIAFRHPSIRDPLALVYTLWHLLPQAAKTANISLSQPTHAHFLYDRGIPLWAGPAVGWLFSQLGGISILRGKLDRLGLRTAREMFATGQFPLALAPEGATNGHNELISPIEPGIAQMAFWCAEDLHKAGTNQEVFIVPLGIKYHYLQENWEALEALMTAMESDCGLPPLPGGKTINPQASELYPRLIRLGNHLLSLMEEFYRQFYHQDIPKDNNQELPVRLKVILDVALRVAEQYFDIKPKGGLVDRCRRLEQAGWDCIYREDIENPEALSPVERGLANLVAEEASLRMWHMRLVESFVAVTGQYVRENPTFERFAETTLLVAKTISRIKGGNPFAGELLGQQRVVLQVGEPLSVTARWDTYQTNRRSAVSELTADLQSALEAMI